MLQGCSHDQLVFYFTLKNLIGYLNTAKNGLINIYPKYPAIRMLNLVLPTATILVMDVQIAKLTYRDFEVGKGKGGRIGGHYLTISIKETGLHVQSPILDLA